MWKGLTSTEEMSGLADLSHVAVEEEASVEALEIIYRDGFHRFVRVAQAITRSRETAVDAVQDAFASLLRGRASYRGTGSLDAWVWSAVVNAARRTLREHVHEP